MTIVLHALPASLVLLIGPLPFAATFSVDGFSAQIAFHILAIAWLCTLYRGYTFIRQSQIQSFAAIVLHGFLGIGAAMKGIFPTPSFADLYSTQRVGLDRGLRGVLRPQPHDRTPDPRAPTGGKSTVDLHR
ncbi:hypothetical protein [Amycolatopsis sp. GA6-003]|uniref:hypothetical protein n=1 Tax=Amycolatopsis sp. GA6-003 TaxID=2652444 RepID=UPI0039170DA2